MIDGRCAGNPLCLFADAHQCTVGVLVADLMFPGFDITEGG
jgi:hypothetical protein